MDMINHFLNIFKVLLIAVESIVHFSWAYIIKFKLKSLKYPLVGAVVVDGV